MQRLCSYESDLSSYCIDGFPAHLNLFYFIVAVLLKNSGCKRSKMELERVLHQQDDTTGVFYNFTSKHNSFKCTLQLNIYFFAFHINVLRRHGSWNGYTVVLTLQDSFICIQTCVSLMHQQKQAGVRNLFSRDLVGCDGPKNKMHLVKTRLQF